MRVKLCKRSSLLNSFPKPRMRKSSLKFPDHLTWIFWPQEEDLWTTTQLVGSHLSEIRVYITRSIKLSHFKLPGEVMLGGRMWHWVFLTGLWFFFIFGFFTAGIAVWCHSERIFCDLKPLRSNMAVSRLCLGCKLSQSAEMQIFPTAVRRPQEQFNQHDNAASLK